METRDYLKILKEEIHSTVVATVDEMGLPKARVIDIMLVDEKSLYFITAKGKAFYKQLMQKGDVAISGMTGGKGSMEKKAISIHGKVKNIGQKLLDKVFEENPYMKEIYPTPESYMALEVFKLETGQGEYFDLSTKPITRGSFAVGEAKVVAAGYYITDKCRGCKLCYAKCPQKCITLSKLCVIQQEHCLHCGNCLEVCPFGAVEKRVCEE